MDAITNLTLKISNRELSLHQKLQAICTAITSSVEACNRVSLWLFDDNRDEIYCIICKDNEAGYSLGQRLHKRDFEPYFSHILQHQVLAASDARVHPATACFNDVYFIPNNIFSLLDYVFHRDFVPAGIMCCERTNSMANWQPADVANLKRISHVTSMFFSDEITAFGQDREQILRACQLQ